MNWSTFVDAISLQFSLMSKKQLYRTSVDPMDLYSKYLSSFPERTNPIISVRTDHDCNTCRRFFRDLGNVVCIVDNKLVSIWDISLTDEPEYQTIANILSQTVKQFPISNVFYHYLPTVGGPKNYVNIDSKIVSYIHLFCTVPNNFVIGKDSLATKLSEVSSTYQVFSRALSDFTLESLDTVQNLVNQNSVYRLKEHENLVDSFRNIKVKYDSLLETDRDIYVWSILPSTSPAISKIRSTVVGTLIEDISKGNDLELCVNMYEVKVAPTNYKRPIALVTPQMVEKAKKTVDELGLSLDRRYACLEDITINDVLFADRSTKQILTPSSVFDQLITEIATVPNLNNVQEITVDKFITEVIPTSTSIEVLFDNSHLGNLMSIVAPVDLTAKPLFKWDNNFSWSYVDNNADSIKQKVKAAGGNVTGDLCCRLAWYNTDDLDFHLIEPDSFHIYYSNKKSKHGGELDVDMNASRLVLNPVENIFYKDKSKMAEGTYILYVNQYNKRNSGKSTFDVEVDFMGTTYSFHYDKSLSYKENIDVIEFKYTHKNGFEILSSLPISTSTVSKDIWGISTNNFHTVRAITFSPNYWQNNNVGNRHIFFILQNCKNDGIVRGFFNEFLRSELDPHRKVIEILGSKMSTVNSNKQLSGIGFSDTMRNSLIVKVSGQSNKTFKVTF